jgi:hypothetical protein
VQHWGCFNPLRDITAAAYWQGQADSARKTYLDSTFDAQHIPKQQLLFFSGEVAAVCCWGLMCAHMQLSSRQACPQQLTET